MAVQVGDVIRIVPVADYLQQEVQNVFHYLVTEWTGSALLSTVAVDFDNNVMQPMSAVQTNNFVYNEIRLSSLSNSADKNTTAVLRGGELASAGAPSFTSASFLLLVTDGVTRPGHKRLAGIPEADITGNVWDSFNTPQAGYIEDAFELTLTGAYGANPGGEYALQPVVYGKPNDNRPVAVFDPVSQAQAQEYITTQNSRKRGVGA